MKEKDNMKKIDIDIDILLNAIINENYFTLINYAERYDFELTQPSEEKIYCMLMQKIENENCYNYFLDLIKEGNFHLLKLMKYSTKIEDIKNCIETIKDIGLSEYIIDLIISIKDLTYLKKCIEKVPLSQLNLKKLLLLTGDLEYIKSYLKSGKMLEKSLINELELIVNETVTIDLPKEMTVGIEIETEGQKFKEEIEGILKLCSKEWKCEDDISLVGGVEIISSVLKNKFKECSREIRSVCSILNGCGQNISDRCGGHIHIGADYLTNVQDYKNLIELWSNAEKILYIISNEKGVIPRDEVLEYAKPISKKIQQSLDKGTINLENESELDNFISDLRFLQVNRGFGINFLNIGHGEKNTIEFRLSNGTLKPNTWIENINLYGGIVKSAHELTIIQNKPKEQRSKEEQEKLNCFKLIKEQGNGGDEEAVLRALLQLCVGKGKMQCYIDRYYTNKPLLESNSKLNNELTNLISQEPIEIN